MIEAHIDVLFDSEWLVAGGDSALGTADLAPMKDDEGFPYVPGRSLRGVIREAVCRVDDCLGSDWAVALFGERIVPGSERHFCEGSVRIGNAMLVREIVAACPTRAERADLYVTVRRTALTPDRVARSRALRTLEVCVPGLVLAADVSVPDERSLIAIAFACGLVRSLGHGRSRGLGRCRLQVSRSGVPVTAEELPPPRDAGVHE